MFTRKNKKVFIIPGLAKAGTTYLFDQLIENDRTFNKPTRKEINYFNKKIKLSKKDYLKNFDETKNTKIFLDASPVYLQSGLPVADRISATLTNWETLVLILMRDPISALFSHYLHDIKSHQGRLSSPRRRLKNFDLNQPEVLAKYTKPKHTEIRKFFETFGSNCVALPMSSLFDGRAHAKIQTLLGEDLKPFNAEARSNEGGFLPIFHYGGVNGSTFEQDGTEYILPPHAMVSAANARSEIRFDLNETEANSILSLAKTFTKRISFSRDTLMPLIVDHEKTCRKFDVSCPISAKYDHEITFDAPYGKVSNEILSNLKTNDHKEPKSFPKG